MQKFIKKPPARRIFFIAEIFAAMCDKFREMFCKNFQQSHSPAFQKFFRLINLYFLIKFLRVPFDFPAKFLWKFFLFPSAKVMKYSSDDRKIFPQFFQVTASELSQINSIICADRLFVKFLSAFIFCITIKIPYWEILWIWKMKA